MKTNTSILALTKAFFILLVMCCFYSCSHGDSLKNTEKFNNYEVITIDSCEYLQWGVSYGFMNVTHKGNCKYCTERAKRSLKQHITFYLRNYPLKTFVNESFIKFIIAYK